MSRNEAAEPAKKQDASQEGGEKPRMRPEDMPSYTPQGRDEPSGEDLAKELPSYTPQGRTDEASDE